MTHTKLSTHVTVSIGLGGERQLVSVYDLLDFLNEWPPARRGPIHGTAHRACRAALAGEIPIEAARQSFVTFARLTNMLVPEVEPVMAARAFTKPNHVPL